MKAMNMPSENNAQADTLGFFALSQQGKRQQQFGALFFKAENARLLAQQCLHICALERV
jgi:hypothetical protein